LPLIDANTVDLGGGNALQTVPVGMH